MRPGGDRASWGPKNRLDNLVDNRPDWGNRGMRPGGDRKSWGPENRKDYWNNWQQDHQAQIDKFRDNRDNDWNQINNWRNTNNHNTYNSASYKNYQTQTNNFWSNRSVEIKNDINVNADHLFNNGWWSDHPWATYGAGVAAGATAAWATHWWWRPCAYTSLTTFLPWAWPPQPPVYDYGVNVVYEGDNVYVNGQSAGNAQAYSQQAVTLAGTPQNVPPPMPPAGATGDTAPPPMQGDWMPLGVWALAPEEKGDASIFFQLSINKEGLISGAYSNVMSGEEAQISGQADRNTKRAAWHIDNNSKTVFETGLSNLTNDTASCLVHYASGKPQTWLLVRMPNPEMPTTTTNLDSNPAPAPQKQ